MAANSVSSEIQKFYAGKSIFVTGATGFVGKMLVEKLLRSCPDIATIYLLTRSRKGKTSDDRIESLFGNVVFDLMKTKVPDFRKKVIAINGDVTLPGLGLSATDRTRISEEVSVIFHVAATVQFDEQLKDAVAVNVNGAKKIIELSRECKNLQAAIHVSTAYSHCPRAAIAEELYPPPMTYEEINGIIESAERRQLSDEMMQSETLQVLERWPNTYAFTKAIAEGVVNEFAEDLPFGIFRPSIGSWKEPVPGWCATLFNLNGAIAGVGLGALHVVPGDRYLSVDIVPVDMTCNCLIAIGWEIATTRNRRCGDIPVYNYVSSAQNSVTWDDLKRYFEVHGYTAASSYAIWHNWVIITKSWLLFSLIDFFVHRIPAILADCLCKLSGRKPMFHKLYSKAHRILGLINPFVTRQWDFENDRVQNLWNQLNSADKEIFPFDIRMVVWKDHTLNVLLGLRKFILKESDDTMERARRRRLALHILHYVTCLVFFGLIIWTTWKLFCGRSLSMFSISTEAI